MPTANDLLLRARKLESKGRMAEAREIYEGILARFPANARARQALERMQAPAPAGQSAQEPAQNVIAGLVGLLQQGRAEAAAAQARGLVQSFPRSATLQTILGMASATVGDLAGAEAGFRSAATLNPADADALSNLGNTLQRQGRTAEAIESHRKALEIRPDFPEASNNLGNALRQDGEPEAAAEAYRRAFARRPDYIDARINLSNALKDMGDVEGAEACLRRALELRPDHVALLKNLGLALADLGRFAEAEAAYRHALALDPQNAEAFRYLTAVTKLPPGAPEFAQMERLRAASAPGTDARCQVCFALYKAYEGIGEDAKAFAALAEGNATRKRLLGHSTEADARMFAKLRETADRIPALAATEPARVTPIFILGMPRSGTTLVEQILSSHSEVHGAGELPHVSIYGAPLALGEVEPTPEALATLRSRYLGRIERLSQGRPYVTDKMPDNFRFLGLIAKALPEAKIIHVNRDPRAVCWSNFSNYFNGMGLGFTCGLEDVVAYWRHYEALMAFWAERHGDRIYQLDYARLTEDPEGETRKLVAHLGLGWEDACLSPQENRRAVATSSQAQIRRPIYRGSNEAWRRYAPFIGAAFDPLGG